MFVTEVLLEKNSETAESLPEKCKYTFKFCQVLGVAF